jgi:Bromodomain
MLPWLTHFMSQSVNSVSLPPLRRVLTVLTDWVKLELPSYPKIIKRPMDLSTMKKKLDNGDYPNPQKFLEDFKLMIRNCMAFNPSGTPVCTAGQQLQKLFDEKWRGLPPLRPPPVSEDEDDDDEDEDSDTERQRRSFFSLHIFGY